MTTAERILYHQIHPVKLGTDWGTAALAALLFWRHAPLPAFAVGFLPSVLVSLVLVRWADLAPYRDSRLGHYIASFMTRRVEAARLLGLFPLWGGAWLRRPGLMGAGVIWILLCWLSGLWLGKRAAVG